MFLYSTLSSVFPVGEGCCKHLLRCLPHDEGTAVYAALTEALCTCFWYREMPGGTTSAVYMR